MKTFETVNLHISLLTLPNKVRFPKLASQVLAEIERQTVLQNKVQDRIVLARRDAIVMLLEGLYQCFCCFTAKAAFSLPISSSAYSRRNKDKIHDHSHTAIRSAISAMESMGWIRLRIGYRKRDGTNIPSSIQPTGDLLKSFSDKGVSWGARPIKRDPIVLKNYDSRTKQAFEIPPPESDRTRKMRANVNRVNQFIGQHAICLHLSNDNLLGLAELMAQESYETEWFREMPIKKPRVFNFSHTSIRRIFSRGDMQKGGRWYGGWWQFVPSEYRQYVTIGGLATGEVDFSELHPRMLYKLSGHSVPEGDLYDLGIVPKDHPRYREVRKIIKRYFNALLNDETSRYKLPPEVQRKLGMPARELKERLLRCHPILREYLGKGIGLEFQYLDSQITEKILLASLERGLVALPIHDSFISQRHRVSELISVMRQAYTEVMGESPILKPVEPYRSDYQLVVDAEGRPDLEALHRMHSQSIHNRFVESWRLSRQQGR